MGLANTANAPILLMPLRGGIALSLGSFEWLFAGSILLAIAATLTAFALPKPGDRTESARHVALSAPS
jgi:hypothetical protein